NLPHFAATAPCSPDRSPLWSMGGADGRQWLDPFLSGLRAHLADDGVAFITHNVFVGLPRTDEILSQHGLAASVLLSTTTVLHPVKSALLSPAIRATAAGRGITRLGRYE